VTTHVGWRAVFLGLVPLVAAGLALLLTAAPGAAPGGDAVRPRGRARPGLGRSAAQLKARRSRPSASSSTSFCLQNAHRTIGLPASRSS